MKVVLVILESNSVVWSDTKMQFFKYLKHFVEIFMNIECLSVPSHFQDRTFFSGKNTVKS